MPSLWVTPHVKPSWNVTKTGVQPLKSRFGKIQKERGGKVEERTADWRIGAQSEAVEKSFRLNAPLHPNNSSTAKKK